MSFYDAEFVLGTVDFRSGEFSGCTVSLQEARFSGGGTDFRHANFTTGGIVEFPESVFSIGSLVDFRIANFRWRSRPYPGSVRRWNPRPLRTPG